MSRLGVCIVGAGGAVASTAIAGVALMKRGLAPRIGMTTETEMGQRLGCVPLESLVFGGWDLRGADIFEAAMRERIVPAHLLREVEPELRAIKPVAEIDLARGRLLEIPQECGRQPRRCSKEPARGVGAAHTRREGFQVGAQT